MKYSLSRKARTRWRSCNRAGGSQAVKLTSMLEFSDLQGQTVYFFFSMPREKQKPRELK